jgi:cation transport regulator ChaC
MDAAAGSLQRIAYPWHGLESRLRSNGSPLMLIGYGSLLNPASARVTLRSVRHDRPVIARGCIRVFDYPISSRSASARYGTVRPGHNAVLNVHPADDAHSVGGVLFDVAIDDIPALRAREVNYDLWPVRFRWFDSPDDADTMHAYILYRPNPPADPMLPHPRYYRVCREGAESLGHAFLDHYLDSTFLQDRVTTIRAWEARMADAPLDDQPIQQDHE